MNRNKVRAKKIPQVDYAPITALTQAEKQTASEAARPMVEKTESHFVIQGLVKNSKKRTFVSKVPMFEFKITEEVLMFPYRVYYLCS